MNVLKESDSRLRRTNFHMCITVVICFLFHKSSERICRVLATSMLQTTHVGFVQEGFSFGINSSSLASCPEDWQMSFRLKTCLTTATATSGRWHPHIWFSLLCSWVFHLMFPNSPQSHTNMVWAEIKCLGFCGDPLIPVLHSLIYLPLTDMKPLNFTPTLM